MVRSSRQIELGGVSRDCSTAFTHGVQVHRAAAMRPGGAIRLHNVLSPTMGKAMGRKRERAARARRSWKGGGDGVRQCSVYLRPELYIAH